MDLEKSTDKIVPAASFAELLALVGRSVPCPFPERPPAQSAAWPPIGGPDPVVPLFASGTTCCAREVHCHARPSVSTSSKNKQGVACSASVSCPVPLELIHTISAQRITCAMAECHYKIVYVPADT